MLSSKKGRIKFLGSAGIILLIVAAWFLLLTPRVASVEQMNLQVETITAQTINDQNNLKKIEKLALDAPDAARRAQALFSRMPYSVNPSDALTVFEDVISAAGVKSSDLQSLTAGVPTQLKVTAKSSKLPGLTESSGNIAEIPVTLSVQTSQAGLIALVEALEKMDRIFIISSISFANKETSSEISVQIKGSVYILQSALPDIVGQIDQLLLEAGIVPSSSLSVADTGEVVLEEAAAEVTNPATTAVPVAP
jgi:Tfp pilus assembly protein PilO